MRSQSSEPFICLDQFITGADRSKNVQREAWRVQVSGRTLHEIWTLSQLIPETYRPGWCAIRLVASHGIGLWLLYLGIREYLWNSWWCTTTDSLSRYLVFEYIWEYLWSSCLDLPSTGYLYTWGTTFRLSRYTGQWRSSRPGLPRPFRRATTSDTRQLQQKT